MTSSEARSSHYKALRDIISNILETFFYFILIWTIKTLTSLDCTETLARNAILEKIYMWEVTFAPGLCLILCIVNFGNIYHSTFRFMTISQGEITYNDYGRLTKHSSALQRMCGTMDIAITTIGGGTEIYFENIENGDEAYQLISQLAKEQECKK